LDVAVVMFVHLAAGRGLGASLAERGRPTGSTGRARLRAGASTRGTWGGIGGRGHDSSLEQVGPKRVTPRSAGRAELAPALATKGRVVVVKRENGQKPRLWAEGRVRRPPPSAYTRPNPMDRPQPATRRKSGIRSRSAGTSTRSLSPARRAGN
jgi:hypothetical protein